MSTYANADTSAWHHQSMDGEAVWTSQQGAWKAVISESQARLVYFGLAEEEANMLFLKPDADPIQSRGGHMLWLGPQSEWKTHLTAWPPPPQWEQMPAQNAIQDADGWLVLVLPQAEHGLPALERAYRWEGDTLQCRASWHGGTGNFQAMHILQIPADTRILLNLSPSDLAPQGMIWIDHLRGHKIHTQFDEAWHLQAIAPQAILSNETDKQPRKYGFSPQAIIAQRGNIQLTMHAGTSSVAGDDTLDYGKRTQVYMGGNTDPMIEIEQISQRLPNAGSHPLHYTIGLQLTFLTPPATSPQQ